MFRTEGIYSYYIYIITNKSKTVLYIGLTNNMRARLYEHRTGFNNGFASRYKVKNLLYYEKFTWIQDAIAREKEIKKWRREKKEALIKTINPEMRFLNYLFE